MEKKSEKATFKLRVFLLSFIFSFIISVNLKCSLIYSDDACQSSAKNYKCAANVLGLQCVGNECTQELECRYTQSNETCADKPNARTTTTRGADNKKVTSTYHCVDCGPDLEEEDGF